MRELGAEPSFPAIVAAGPNGALPHAEPSEREIGAGELVVLDMGAKLDGYCSDCTRTFASGELGDGGARGLRARARGAGGRARGGRAGRRRRGCRRGRARGDRGRRPRASTSATGSATAWGSRSTRRRAWARRSEDVLVAGDVVTVEPGVYLPGRFGVRIEDLVVVTDDGHRNLSSLPKELRVVA